MALKRVTRSNTSLETTTTTTVTNAQLQAMIDQGVIAALAARDANRSTNGDDSHVSGTGTTKQFSGTVSAAVRMFPEESDKIERYVNALCPTCLLRRTDIYEKDEKRRQNDKTGHGTEKHGKDKVKPEATSEEK
ncbi:hypothetical protein Tco_0804523 [Tanacetum coccineum]|uniref:Uncharacterized protein n=1 Tax=Tanacetum coccineum TaxID=301880 RepID=A0ABQ5A8U1_9ASTR